MRIIDKIVSQVGRRVDEASPMVDARLPDGSRVNAIIPPLALRGPTVTIRKFSRDPYTINDLISFGTLTARSAQFLAACVKGKLNILISGGTGTGKTTTLNAMSAFIPGDERIVTIEDAAELQLQQDHVVTLESRPANIEGRGEIKIRELVRNALRMRPDRIIVGEVRGAETLDMLQAMNTGHEGSLTTIHANSPRDALARLETLVLTARRRAAAPRDPRADRERVRPARADRAPRRRLTPCHRTSPRCSGWRRTSSRCRTSSSRRRRARARPTRSRTGCCSPLRATGLKPHFLEKLAANNVVLPPSFFSADDSDQVRASFAATGFGGGLRMKRRALRLDRRSRGAPARRPRPRHPRIQAVDASSLPVAPRHVCRAGRVAPRPTLRENGRPVANLAGGQPRPDEEHRARDRPFAVDARAAARERDRGRAAVRRRGAAPTITSASSPSATPPSR